MAYREKSQDKPILSVRELSVAFNLKERGSLSAVDGISIDIAPSEILGLVGESGCGKTVFSLSLLRLITSPGYIKNGEIFWNGYNLINLNHRDLLKIRGKEIAMIFQSPESSLNPVYTIGSQLISVLRLHHKMSTKDAQDEAVRLLNLVSIPDPERVMNSYPHQLSGGMCQRVMIAIAISCRPKLLIADEPTASLDVTIQAQIMDLLMDIRKQYGMAILLVSHDLGVIAHMCDRIAVMYLGRIVEYADSENLYGSPLHPYTQGLLQSVPIPDPHRKGKITKIQGDIPSPMAIPSGCRFRSRCPKSFDKCASIDPQLHSINNGNHLVACLLYQEGKN